MSNILLGKFDTVRKTIPFGQIKNEDFLPAFQELIAEGEKEIDAIANNPEPANFENTIEALAYSGRQLDLVSNIFFNLNSAETSEELQKIAQEVSPLLTEFSSKISQNEPLFARVKEAYDRRKDYQTNREQRTLLDDTYQGFVRNGALLSPEDKEKLKEIDKELSIKSLKFGQNALGATNAYFKHFTQKEALAGIPEDILAQFAEDAQNRKLEGWVVTLQAPSYRAFMKFAQNRELRKELYLANGHKAFDHGEFDNRELIKELINLRQKKARLLGFRNYAEYVLDDRMAKTPDAVLKFLQDLLEKAKPYGEKELKELQELAAQDGITDLQIYDHAYYAEKLRRQKFSLNDEELKPYFPLKQVQAAVFNLAHKLFSLTFVERNDIPKYHPDVQTFEVYEDISYKGILYMDFFPREGKRAGAWMTVFKNQYKKDGKNYRPHISIVTNFSKPTADTPSLLTFDEVTTLFHEFGHSLHGLLANTQYPELSGTSVKWDFVELPSQFLENFAYEPQFLKTFAKHYQTGEVLPEEKIHKINQSKNFMEGYQTLRQLGFGFLDLGYHTTPEQVQDIESFEESKFKETSLYPFVQGTAMSPTFTHIFHGGYDAGYYSYKWAEVLDADAFSFFKETGIFYPTTAAKYKQMLAAGGTEDPMELYKTFRGREPRVEPLLKRAFG